MMDFLLQAWVSANIERAKLGWILGKGERWEPGQRLKLLLVGYNGTRNTGSDVRPEETLRQLRHILGDAQVEFSVLSQNFELTRGYFQGSEQVHLPDIFPPFVAREVPRHHGVIVHEGSAFKSKFANALTTMMIGCLGTAAAENKLAVGYGSEAGHMDPLVEKMCARYCKECLIITRNEESRTRLHQLGVAAELGTDTAWTFQPLPPEYGRKELARLGWDGKLPVLIVCPINPFWWPVKPSLAKYVALQVGGAYRDSHYRTLYFHKSGPEIETAFERYLTAMANAVRAFRDRYRVFPLLVATEQLDGRACHRIAEKLGGAAVATSAEYDMYQMVSILRAAHLMVSSRFHGIVTSMPALVPSAGVTMDERIRNLMRERGHQDLLMEVDDPDLESKLLRALERLAADGQQIADGIGSAVVKNLKTMARMGVYFEEELRRRYPEFPTRSGQWGWEDYLPPLDAGLQRLLAMYS